MRIVPVGNSGEPAQFVEARTRLHDRLTGQHDHALDEKGRISVPASFRAKLGLVEGSEVVITRHLSDRCVLVYRPDAFEQTLERAESADDEKALMALRVLSGAARTQRIDKLGRVTIPTTLRAFALLEGDCFVIGQDQHIEVWNQAEWETAHDASRFQGLNIHRLL